MEKNKMRRYTFDTFDNWKEAGGFLATIGVLGALTFGVYSLPRLPPGVKDDRSVIHGTYQGFQASVYETSHDLQVSVGVNNKREQFYVSGRDFNKDGRIDKIQLVGVPEGNALENLANTQELDKVVREVKSQGSK